ncbi:hypothetical protein DPMN_151486 [Dreissena polymorpha]|uniref:Uncharacterized protein n=1 Tax=Dreissena polymorpha TaxID=45954 RepID=A0A9D4FH79_DREPO|nr:hypothetical protein DPMN_151486 [Dreissena polymorpha]
MKSRRYCFPPVVVFYYKTEAVWIAESLPDGRTGVHDAGSMCTITLTIDDFTSTNAFDPDDSEVIRYPLKLVQKMYTLSVCTNRLEPRNHQPESEARETVECPLNGSDALKKKKLVKQEDTPGWSASRSYEILTLFFAADELHLADQTTSAMDSCISHIHSAALNKSDRALLASHLMAGELLQKIRRQLLYYPPAVLSSTEPV